MSLYTQIHQRTSLGSSRSKYENGIVRREQPTDCHSTEFNRSRTGSLAHGIKEKGGPAITIWRKLLAHYHYDDKDWKLVIRLHEDNNAAVTGAMTGKNPSCKSIDRNFGVKVRMISERIKALEYLMVKTKTDFMSADIYTKVMDNPTKFDQLQRNYDASSTFSRRNKSKS